MKRLKIAIQKSGRLHDESLKLLRACGIRIPNGLNQLKVSSPDFPLEVLYLRNSDIPRYLTDGVAHLGIAGENLIIEQELPLETLQPLGFSTCRLSLAVPKGVDYPGISFFEGKSIATSYPNSLKKFLGTQGIEASIHKISGSVEIAPGIGLSDGICDLVSTGNTLFTNGLKEVEVVLKSQAVLVKGQWQDPEMVALMEKLLFRIRAVLGSRTSKYVLLNAPVEKVEIISDLLPGMKSPTVVPLAKPGWVAMHSVMEEKDFWNVIEQLQDLGAEGILIIPIEKMIV